MTASLDMFLSVDRSIPKTTEQNLTVRIGKSEAKVGLTNNERLRSMYCTIEDTDRHKKSCGLSATAGLLVLLTRGLLLLTSC